MTEPNKPAPWSRETIGLLEDLHFAAPEMWEVHIQLWIDNAVERDRDRIRTALEALETTPLYGPGEEDYMCPNCVTPWKCNGPHTPEVQEIVGYDVPLDDVLRVVDGE